MAMINKVTVLADVPGVTYAGICIILIDTLCVVPTRMLKTVVIVLTVSSDPHRRTGASVSVIQVDANTVVYAWN